MKHINTKKLVFYTLFIAVMVSAIYWLSLSSNARLQADFFDIDESQLEISNIFGEIEPSTSIGYSTNLSENGLPAGRITIDTELDFSVLAATTSWNSIFAIQSGNADPKPYNIVVLAKTLSAIPGESAVMQFGIYIADPGVDPEERIVWGGDGVPASEITEEDAIEVTDDLNFILEWSSEIGQPGVNAYLEVRDSRSLEPLYMATTNVVGASFAGAGVDLIIGTVSTCEATSNPFAGITIMHGNLLARENSETPNTTYTCETELYDLTTTELEVEEGEMPGTGVMIQDRTDIPPVDITEVVPDASGASLYFEPSNQEMKVVATVDPEGNGDYRTIQEALKFIDAGMIAIAGGEYYVESIAVPNGVTLSGGWDKYGFRTVDIINNPTYIFHIGKSEALINLTGDTSNIEGLILTSDKTCVNAAGKAHKIANNAFRDCNIGIHVFGIAYTHIVNNTFYNFNTGVLLEDFAAAKILNNIFKSGNTAIQENTAS